MPVAVVAITLFITVWLRAEPLAPPRIAAMADWHGDLEAARHALRLAGAIDESDRWIGGALVVVQTGDVLDRGDDDRAILDLLTRLETEATAAGGAVIALVANHEVMNAAGDLEYATPGGFAAFADVTVDPADTTLAALPPAQRGRAAALRPGGPYARHLAQRNVVAVVGRNVFVHGGILPAHLDMGLERINRETSAWLRGDEPQPPWLNRRDSPIWARDYSDDPDSLDCEHLAQVLAALDCDRMFVGHTVQEGGVTARCRGHVWCLDSGASQHYGGRVEVVEIRGDSVRVLR